MPHYKAINVWVHQPNQIKSNLFFSSRKNNTQYKSILYKYDIPLLNEWMVIQADTNTIPDLGP